METYNRSGRSLILNCPRCGKKDHFWVYVQPPHHGICWVCGYRALLNLRQLRKQSLSPTDSQLLPNSLPKLVPAIESQEALDYLRSRGFRVEKLPEEIFHTLSWDPEEGTLFVKLNRITSGIPGWMCRKSRPEGPWKTFPGTRTREHIYYPRKGEKVVLVEGIFDALRVGPGGLALLGTYLSEEKEWFLATHLGSRDLIIWLDPDPAGDKCAEYCLRRLSTWGIQAEKIQHHHEPDDCGCFEIWQKVRSSASVEEEGNRWRTKQGSA